MDVELDLVKYHEGCNQQTGRKTERSSEIYINS
jgi:hypothetical protein